MSEARANDWLRRARAAADLPPLRPREPLHLAVNAGSVLVGSLERQVAERMSAAGLPVRRVSEGWQVDAPAAPSLATIAAWLREAGVTGRWRDELLAIVDQHERAVAEIERSAVRVLGLTTYAVHLVGFTFDGRRTWVQQRAFDKATDPGLWDTLMGGQVAAGETLASALARETEEEAGLDVASLLDLRRGERITLRRPVAEGYLVEHVDTYTARLPDGVEPANRDGEVVRFECVDAGELDERLAGGEFTLEASLVLAAAIAGSAFGQPSSGTMRP